MYTVVYNDDDDDVQTWEKKFIINVCKTVV